MTHANYGRLAPRIRPKDPCSHATNGVAINLIDFLRHFGDWDLATMYQYLGEKL